MSDFHGSFLTELKRRHVVRVGLVYGAVGYAILEVADILVGTFRLPDALQTGIGVVVLVGFPIALALGWAFDLTPQGIKRADEQASPTAEAASASWISMRTLGSALLFLLVGLGAGWMTGRAGSVGDGPVRSVAVLPFEDLSAEGDQAYFGDGIAEELLNVLARNGRLRVAARTSAFTLAREGATIDEVGEALGVESVVEGSVRKSGDRVRITAQLIQVSDGFHLWSDTYEGDLSDIFALQDQISAAIAQELEAELGMVQAQASDNAGRPVDPEAYDLYLQARSLIVSRLPDALREGVGLLEGAIEIDPTFAAAYAMLGEAYTMLPIYVGKELPDDWTPRAKWMADRAIRLEPDHPNGWAVRGVIGWAYDWDLPQAERNLAKAIELSPGYSAAHTWLGLVYQTMGRTPEMLASCEKGLDLDPLYTIALLCMARARWLTGDLQAAREFYERLVRLHPDYATGVRELSRILVEMGDREQAHELMKREADIYGFDDPEGWAAMLVPLDRDQIDESERPEAVRLIERYLQATNLAPDVAAIALYRIGALDRGFAAIEESVRLRRNLVVELGGPYRSFILERDPRVQELMHGALGPQLYDLPDSVIGGR